MKRQIEPKQTDPLSPSLADLLLSLRPAEDGTDYGFTVRGGRVVARVDLEVGVVGARASVACDLDERSLRSTSQSTYRLGLSSPLTQ